MANAFKIYNFVSDKPQRMKDFLDLVDINIVGTFNVIRLALPLLATNPISKEGTLPESFKLLYFLIFMYY